MASLEINVNQVNSDFNGIKKAIIATGVEVADGIATSEYANKVTEVYEAGKASGGGVDNLQYAKAVQFNSLNDLGRAEVELNLDKCTTLYIFCGQITEEKRNTTVEHLTINNALPTDMAFFLQCAYPGRDLTLKRLTLNFDTSNVKSFQKAFECMTAVEIIDGNPLDFSGINTASTISTNNTFNYTTALKEIRFVENSIPGNIHFNNSDLLSEESIQSIIYGLADLASGMTLTLNKTAVNNAFETSSGLADGSTSEEWLNLVATKTNWTISLV